MRGYVILNGCSSKDITGLLITSLPNITKPQVRTTKEETDGKDGDEVTKLGYSAYDKEIGVGLTYNYDVDKIIKFFDSEGFVTFSNEPDKFYKYAIYEQIDFEKLIRFKTAKIKMHVQPFKYSLSEHKKVFRINTENNVVIRNNGNIYSRPIVKIKGSGNISLYLNDVRLHTINLTEDTEITIDFEKMNAYNEESKELKNRLVTGNYDKFILKPGKNTISWNEGKIDEICFENYSRWI